MLRVDRRIEDVPGIKTKVTTKDILNVIIESRAAEPNASADG
jgi:hypothetical protein